MSAVTFAHIAHRLGVSHRSAHWQARYLRALIADHGFPAPFPYLAWRPAAMRWDGRAVEQWFDDRAADAAGRLDATETRVAADLMDARAERL